MRAGRGAYSWLLPLTTQPTHNQQPQGGQIPFMSPQDKAERAAELLVALSSAGSEVGRAVREGTAELIWRETSPQHFLGRLARSKPRPVW